MSEIDVREWLQATIDTAKELASGTLGFGSSECLPNTGEPAAKGIGSYVPILSPVASLHIGLLADNSGCAALTKALLGMGPDEAASEDDITDAIGEIANMLGGGVKTRLSSREPKLQLGLPIFVEGRIHASHQSQTAFGKIRLGETTVELLVIKATRT